MPPRLRPIASSADPTEPVASGVLRRALNNAGLLLGGKGAAGLMQLATFALAARGLGLEQFGYFSIMLAQTQLLIGIATFQSNQAIVRYGVLRLGSGDRRGFQALAKFGTLLDWGAACFAALATYLTATLVGQAAGWDERLIHAAQLLALLPFTAAIATPKGLLRLFGRFDLLAKHVTATPLVRLLGVAAVGLSGGGLLGYVGVWLFAGMVGAAVALWLGWREARRRGQLAGFDWSMRHLAAANPGIWRFSIISNLHSSLLLLPGHLSTFTVGMMLGPQAAGLMKVAQELGTGLAKPIDLINQTVYPDIARLAAQADWRRLRRLDFRAGAAAAAISALITVLLYLFGEWLIGLVFGAGFVGAYAVLLLISMATILNVAVFAADPTLYALGKPSRPLASAAIANAMFAAVLISALPGIGLAAAGAAYLSAGLVNFALSIFWLKRMIPPEPPAKS